MSGLYLHIPFCKQKCIYCDFYSLVNDKLQGEYVNSIINELECRINEINGISTIYIGGGTPSILSKELLYKLVVAIKKHIDISNISEFTIEVNPDDINLEYCNFLRSLDINRVSMGVQSFVDSELNIINRRHTAYQVEKALCALRESKFDNISIDLMFGLPGQTIESWGYTLNKVVEIAPEHISAYSLMYEEGTRLYQMRAKGSILECSEELSVKMYEMLVKKLSDNGYVHYEISNFSKPWKQSIHNCSYWNETPYLGLGPGAHSFDGLVRRSNPHALKRYINKLSQKQCIYDTENETIYEKYNDYILTRLRTVYGIEPANLKIKFGEVLYNHFSKELQRYIDNGDVKIMGERVYLSEIGMIKSDLIIRDLFFVEDYS